MTCTFFGHSDASRDILPLIKTTIINLITEQNVDNFLVGEQGNFDYMVRDVLRELKAIYPHISYSIVLAYMPSKKHECDFRDYSDTIYPHGLEKTPIKFAILKRNEWLIKNSDIVVTYVKYSFGGAAKAKELAERKGKRVINII